VKTDELKCPYFYRHNNYHDAEGHSMSSEVPLFDRPRITFY